VDCRALLQSDVVVLLGARLNWILHFGLPPRFDPHVKVIQVGQSSPVGLLFKCYFQDSRFSAYYVRFSDFWSLPTGISGNFGKVAVILQP
jgi:hypothetical protein